MMSRNPNFKEYIDTLAVGQIVLETICPWCGKKQRLVLDGSRANDYKIGRDKYIAGCNIQDAFPSFSSDEREFILTGICSACWNNL